MQPAPERNPGESWDTGTHEGFYQYYEERSLSRATLMRFRQARDLMLQLMGPAMARQRLRVADVGCGAGSQGRLWAQLGHQVFGMDINRELVTLGRRRTAEEGFDIAFSVGSATALPWSTASMDVVLVPELLEHVADWRTVIAEAVRILKPGGFLYLSTTNKLCPKQEEFQLPFYSWYPGFLKRRYERLAVTTRPELVKYAKYPAVNWFTFFGLRDHLAPHGFRCYDRFDLMDTSGKPRWVRLARAAICRIPPLRVLGHVATDYTVLVAQKIPAG